MRHVVMLLARAPLDLLFFGEELLERVVRGGRSGGRDCFYNNGLRLGL
jgi:hypothetical protein